MQLSALPSSSFTRGSTYDVFLSFRGVDTRTTFTGHLYDSLCRRGIHTFFDDKELRRGEEIEPSLVNAIKESRIAIIVFSQNYASSTFCLDELVNILEHIKGKDQFVWPVFYNVDPSEIRHLSGSFKYSLAKHEERFKDDKEKLLKWRLALQKAANLSGNHLKSGHQYEHEFIGRIVEEVSRKINHIPLHVADNPVELATPVQNVISLLELELDDRVNMVGICGTGGIGKSTIARAVYNYIADQFQGTCFLNDVREKSNKQGLEQLQETLLSELVGERNIKVGYVHKGIPVIIRRLRKRKILLVLDDVDRLEQLQKFAGGRDWFGCGSRVIITTRDKHLLARHGVESVYEVKLLNHWEALELFSWNAFKNHEVDPNFLHLSNRIVHYAGGLPLALKVIGSSLFGKGIEQWRSALAKYKSIPNKEIHEILKVSYDGLEHDEKEIFLDIACFFRGELLNDVKPMLDACCLCTEYSIGVLVDKCLLDIDKVGKVTMHDLIQETGKEIVRQQSINDVGKRSRLWSYNDIIHVLEENMGSDKTEVIILNPPQEIEVHWNGKAFKKMKNLRILVIRNTHFARGPEHLPNSLRVLEWWGYPSSTLPCNFHGRQLVILKLGGNCFLWHKPLQEFRSLSLMHINKCVFLRQIPDLSGAPYLKALRLDYCRNLIEIHDSVGFLKKLETLSAACCENLSFFPRSMNLPSLRILDLWGCTSLRNFPEISGENENKLWVYLQRTAIEELPSSIRRLRGLVYICFDENRCLNRVPSGILMLPVLWSFEAKSCTRFQFYESSECQEQEKMSRTTSLKLRVDLTDCDLKDEFFISPTCISLFCHVVDLDLSSNSFTVLPASFNQFLSLKVLHLDYCEQLREIEGFPPYVENFSALNCTALSPQSSSLLVRQALLKTGRCIILLGDGVPERLPDPSPGGALSFGFHKDTPVTALCFVIDDPEGRFRSSDFSVLINNGTRVFGHALQPFADHLKLCYLEWEDVKFCRHDFNRVDILTKDLQYIGVYIIKSVKSIEDIRFEDPYQHHGKRVVKDICYNGNDLDLNCFPPQKKQCTSLHVEPCEISDTQQQQLTWDAVNWNSTSNVPSCSSDNLTCQDKGHDITNFQGEGTQIGVRKMMHLELDLNDPPPMEEDEAVGIVSALVLPI